MAQASNAAGMTGEKKLREARLNEIRAFELFSAGATYEQIAQQVPYASRGAAHRAVQRALSRVEVNNVSDMRKVENRRLDTLLMAVWADARRGKIPAVVAALRIMDRRARLNGLDRPTVLQIEGSGDPSQQSVGPQLREVLPAELVADVRSVRAQALALHRALPAGASEDTG